MARAYIGTSGFTYDHWKGIFYPPDVPQKNWLEYFAREFDTVELNNTFYAMPKPGTCATWQRRVPAGFTFAVKLYRVITHRYRLMNFQRLLGDFLSAVDCIRDKLGPVLVQLPPKWHANPERLANFLEQVPPGYRWAVEFRDERWLCEEVYDVLRRHNAALVVHDHIKDHPRIVTANFVYLRYHGAAGGGGEGLYTDAQMQQAAGEVQSWVKRGLDTYVYFNNDWRGYALTNARQLKSHLAVGKRRRAG